MRFRSPTGFCLAGLFSLSLLPGCTKKADPAAATEMRRLREEIAAMKVDRAKDDENDSLKAENQALKAGVIQIDTLRTKLEAAEREAERLRKEIEDLRKTNAELRAKAVFRARSQGIGESFPQLACPGGRTYQNAVIRSIEDGSVTIRHDGGVATLQADAVPREWVKRFFLEDGSRPVAVAASIPVAPASTGLTAPASTASTATTPAAGPASEDEIANRLTRAALIIKGDKSQGTGFFAREGGTIWLYTAAHVLSGNTTLVATGVDGRTYNRFGVFQIAENADIARLAMLEPVPVAADLLGAGPCAIGSEVVAIGNSGGGGVFNVLRGSVKALGPGEVETDAAVIQGNSGGMLCSAADGRVIGVVTHLMQAREDVWSEGTPFREIRRFAARLDGNVTWREMTIANFTAEPRTINDFNRVTRLLYALSALHPSKNGLHLNTKLGNGITTILAIFNENRGTAAVDSLLKMNDELASNNLKISDKDLSRRFIAYYSSIANSAHNQTNNFDPARISAYHRDAAKLSLQWRQKAEAELAEQITALGNIGR